MSAYAHACVCECVDVCGTRGLPTHMVVVDEDGRRDHVCDCVTPRAAERQRTKEILRPYDQDGVQCIFSKKNRE